MGSHRAQRRETTPRRHDDSAHYVGRRVAGRAAATQTVPLPAVPEPTVDLAAITAEIPLLSDSSASLAAAVPGKRRAVKRKARGPLSLLPSAPVLAGVATLAVAAGGAVTSAQSPQLAANAPRMTVPNAQTGAAGSGFYDALGRGQVLSRDSQREALANSTDADLEEEAEAQADERSAALSELATQAQAEARDINLNRWVLPTSGYHLTSRFGECSYLWSACHTGLDFATGSGTPIVSVANGVVTETGSDGAYGNKTVVTLDDGTEIWYCHQTSITVSVGDNVVGGQVIGTVGSTGNTTGPHLHLEVRPGGGDPVDPWSALVAHGVTP